MSWKFYGRKSEVTELAEILSRKQWVFLKIDGRRRIGKTSLIQQALPARYQEKSFYMQVPDSSPAGVLTRFREAMLTHGVQSSPPRSLQEMARAVEQLISDGWAVILDEFQYFVRKPLFEFNSFLQESVDRVQSRSDSTSGPLIVLGSLHTEMSALLEDRHAPLFGRATNKLTLEHLLPSTVSEILVDHNCLSPSRLLFLWNLFEGVPKFYRDAFEQGVLAADHKDLLDGLFFRSAAPLRSEAENWFLAELRGQYDAVLNALARNSMCSHGDLMVALRVQYGEKSDSQIGSYLKTLTDKYRLVERLLPIFAKPNSRNARYRIKDFFLTSWLSSLRAQVEASQFRRSDFLISRALELLQANEGFALEEMVRRSIRERSRLGVGDIQVTKEISGYWHKKEVEIDFVCIDEENKIVRFVSCKRNPTKALRDLESLQGHVSRFLQLSEAAFMRDWSHEFVLAAPQFSKEQRSCFTKGPRARLMDLGDLGLTTAPHKPDQNCS